MGSSPDQSAASETFLAAFRANADADAAMTFCRFMELALYHPEVGYYRRDRVRVGYGGGTDFYTASTTEPVFGELVSAACAQLLHAAKRDPREHTFVEIGPEPGGGVLANVSHPFARTRTVRVGEPLGLSGHCVVFSNELFDAQPCTRSVFRAGAWRELGVRLDQGQLRAVELPGARPKPPGAGTTPACEDYHFDQPLAAAALADTIAAQPWRGLFVAFDYGKTLRELAGETPAGTLRAYHQHRQSNDLLARPGEQDLTCHICWDWMMAALRQNGFSEPLLDFQEAFFIRNAAEFIATTSETEAARFSRRKLALLQLLHPAQMGQKFQVLHALR